MSITVRNLIRASLRDIGVLAKNEDATADEYADALVDLNMMIGEWSVSPLMVLGAVMGTVTVSASDNTYTIGASGADVTAAKPSTITDAFIRDSNSIDTGVAIITLEEWNALTSKAISTGRPYALYYDPGESQQAVHTGTINLYPIPDASYTLYIGEQKPLTEFSAITETVTFAPFYYSGIRYSLAERLWPQYKDDNRPFPPHLAKLKTDTMNTIRTANAKQHTATIEVPGRGGTSNIYIGSSV